MSVSFVRDASHQFVIARFCQDWNLGSLKDLEELLNRLEPLWAKQSELCKKGRDRMQIEEKADSLGLIKQAIERGVDEYLEGKKIEQLSVLKEALCSFPSYLHVYRLFRPT